ncbi:MAG: isochorismatase family protein [Holophagales bacterium]|nr:isochorismatase family protein [Holophagales bacterium]
MASWGGATAPWRCEYGAARSGAEHSGRHRPSGEADGGDLPPPDGRRIDPSTDEAGRDVRGAGDPDRAVPERAGSDPSGGAGGVRCPRDPEAVSREDLLRLLRRARLSRALDELRPRLRTGARQVVVAGIEAHVCVMQTVLELIHWGNQAHVSWDAVSGRGEEYRRHALERMAAAGAAITNHESVGFEWARDKNHPRFKELSTLFKGAQPAG